MAKAAVFQPMEMGAAASTLSEVKQILDRLGHTFFLRHGTCLGAVRNGTFIGWDDDLDIGSVIGLHDLTEKSIRHAAATFKLHGFNCQVIDSELHMSVDLKKNGIQIDWTCYRIIRDSIYQWPVVRIPVDLHRELREIEFLGERFLVPNPPEEYLTLKYGPDWRTPKKAGEFEQEVLDLMANTVLPSDRGGLLRLGDRFVPGTHTGSLRVLDLDGEPVMGAEVSLAATTVLTGLEKSRTGEGGQVHFSLPEQASYVVAVQSGSRSEILYLEELRPGVDYVYRPDPDHPSGRANALLPLHEYENVKNQK